MDYTPTDDKTTANIMNDHISTEQEQANIARPKIANDATEKKNVSSSSHWMQLFNATNPVFTCVSLT